MFLRTLCAMFMTAMVILVSPVFLYAEDSGWHRFESSGYKPASYHPRKDILYLETRIYDTNANYDKVDNKKYKVAWKFYRKPLSSFDKKTVRWFKRMPPRLSPETDIHKSSYRDSPPLMKNNPMKYTIGNAFFINGKGEAGRMNTKADIISSLGKIDTESELNMVLMLRGDTNCKRYRKTKSGYEAECIDDSFEVENSRGPCGIYRYRVLVTFYGRIKKRSKSKLVKKMPCAMI